MFHHATVVPALGDPCRERPPDVYGHVINVPTHFNVKLPAIGRHLPNADADIHLLVVRTCYNGQCKQIQCFGGHFHPKSLAACSTLSCNRQFAKMSMLPSGDRKQCFISRVCLRDEPCDCGKSDPLATFVLRHQIVKVMHSVLNPRC